MKITFEEIKSKSEHIHIELLNSLSGELIEKAKEDQFFDVKILVNGIEMEPKLFNSALVNLEMAIKNTARMMLQERLYEIESKVEKLNDLFNDASNKIIDEFELESEKNY